MEALADRVQVPGPRSGTSTDPKPGPSVPESAPLSALAFDIGATRLTLVVVTLEKLLATDNVVTVVATVTTFGGVRCVGVVVGLVVGTRVVAGDVEEGGGDEASGARGADAEVRVKTRMRSKSGLDHINRCALFREKGERGIIFEG